MADFGPRKANTDIYQYIQAVEDIINSQDKPPFVVGHSMGGLIALSVATRHHLPGVVTVCSAPPAGIWNLNFGRIFRFLKYTKKILAGDLFILNNSDIKALVSENEEIQRHLVPDSGKVAWQIQRQVVTVKELLCPGLVIAGTKDRMMPATLQRRIARRYELDYSESNHGHTPMMEPEGIVVLNQILTWCEGKVNRQ